MNKTTPDTVPHIAVIAYDIEEMTGLKSKE